MRAFKLELAEERVELEKPDGSRQVVTIRELDGAGRDRYMAAVQDRVSVRADGTVEATSLEGLGLALLAETLYGEDGALIPAEVIGSWPARVTDALNEIAQELSALSSSAKEEAGNA